MNVHSGDIELSKLLTLKQYLHIYAEIKRAAAEPHCTGTDRAKSNVLDASIVMMRYVIMHSLCASTVLFLVDLGCKISERTGEPLEVQF